MKIENVPSELRKFPNWVAWRYEQTESGKPTKVPYSPVTGRRADSTNAQDWSRIDDAFAHRIFKKHSGIGFNFSESPYSGIDLDYSEDAEVRAYQDALVRSFDSYTELSPSGKGRHIIVRGKVPSGRKDRKHGVEVYSDARYFTFTGDSIGRCEVAERQNLLTKLWEELGTDAAGTAQIAGAPVQTESDEAILSKAGNASNAEKFRALWSGDIRGHANDHSAADQALVNILAFYSQNREQIKRIFRLSGLGQRKKATREDYLERTITKAFDQMIPVVAFDMAQKVNGAGNGVPSVTSPLRSAVEQPTPTNIAQSDRPPGLLGDIAEFIYAQAPVPARPIALAGAIGLMAGICSRSYSISNKGLNQYIVLLAKTGRGKEAMASGISRLIGAVAQQEPAAGMFVGPGRIASGPALHKCFTGPLPSFVSVIGEIGLWTQKLCAKYARQNETEILGLVLDVYGKSGPHDLLQPLVYSDRAKNTITVRAPGLTILGESTFEQFYEAVDEDSIRSGLLPRYLLIEYTGQRAPYNEGHDYAQIDPALLSRLIELCAFSVRMNQKQEAVPVVLHPSVWDQDRAFRLHCDDMVNRESSESAAELWNRAHLKTLKLAALVAVGQNPYQPSVMPTDYEWATGMVVSGIETMMRRFETGEVGNPVNATRQHADAQHVIQHFFTPAFEPFIGGNKINPTARDSGFIPLHYIKQRLRRIASFRNDRDTNGSIDRVLRSLEDEGYLMRVQDKGANGMSSTYFRVEK